MLPLTPSQQQPPIGAMLNGPCLKCYTCSVVCIGIIFTPKYIRDPFKGVFLARGSPFSSYAIFSRPLRLTCKYGGPSPRLQLQSNSLLKLVFQKENDQANKIP